MSERFYSAEPITGDRVKLDGLEAHHLLHVMRAAVGDSVVLFDGTGVEYTAVVESLGRSRAELRVVNRQEIDRELSFPLTVGIALPKGDRQKWLVEKLTELGVGILVPLVTERGVAQPTAGALERLRRGVVEASKQCGRNRLMEIAEPRPWMQWISGAWPGSSSESSTSRRLLAHPSGSPLDPSHMQASMPTQIAIGPEGGYSEAELSAAASAGWETVGLGARILRVETAAIALTAAVALTGESNDVAR